MSIEVSQFPHNALVGNPNRSFSEFDSCLQDLVLQVHAAAAHNCARDGRKHRVSFGKIIGHSHFHNSEPYYCMKKDSTHAELTTFRMSQIEHW